MKRIFNTLLCVAVIIMYGASCSKYTAPATPSVTFGKATMLVDDGVLSFSIPVVRQTEFPYQSCVIQICQSGTTLNDEIQAVLDNGKIQASTSALKYSDKTISVEACFRNGMGQEIVSPSSTFTIPLLIERIELSQENLSLYLNKETKINANVLPAKAGASSLSWQSEAPNIATVSANGMVKAISPGTAVIIAKSQASGALAKCNLDVYGYVSTPQAEIKDAKIRMSIDVASFVKTVGVSSCGFKIRPENEAEKIIYGGLSDNRIMASSLLTQYMSKTLSISAFVIDRSGLEYESDITTITIPQIYTSLTFIDSELVVSKKGYFALDYVVEELSSYKTDYTDLEYSVGDTSIAKVFYSDDRECVMVEGVKFGKTTLTIASKGSGARATATVVVKGEYNDFLGTWYVEGVWGGDQTWTITSKSQGSSYYISGLGYSSEKIEAKYNSSYGALVIYAQSPIPNDSQKVCYGTIKQSSGYTLIRGSYKMYSFAFAMQKGVKNNVKISADWVTVGGVEYQLWEMGIYKQTSSGYTQCGDTINPIRMHKL